MKHDPREFPQNDYVDAVLKELSYNSSEGNRNNAREILRGWLREAYDVGYDSGFDAAYG